MRYAQKWADRISGEFVSKYTVFSHKGGVRILADKSTKIKRLRLSRETIIQLDALIAARRIKIHAHLRARVFIMYGVFGIHFLASTTSSFIVWGKFLGPLTRWGRNSLVRSSLARYLLRSPLSRVLATFDYQNNLRLSAQHLLSQMRFFVYSSRISFGCFFPKKHFS